MMQKHDEILLGLFSELKPGKLYTWDAGTIKQAICEVMRQPGYEDNSIFTKYFPLYCDQEPIELEFLLMTLRSGIVLLYDHKETTAFIPQYKQTILTIPIWMTEAQERTVRAASTSLEKKLRVGNT
jgi:hypothetical protein